MSSFAILAKLIKSFSPPFDVIKLNILGVSTKDKLIINIIFATKGTILPFKITAKILITGITKKIIIKGIIRINSLSFGYAHRLVGCIHKSVL